MKDPYRFSHAHVAMVKSAARFIGLVKASPLLPLCRGIAVAGRGGKSLQMKGVATVAMSPILASNWAIACPPRNPPGPIVPHGLPGTGELVHDPSRIRSPRPRSAFPKRFAENGLGIVRHHLVQSSREKQGVCNT
jgi:hypothetical protein